MLPPVMTGRTRLIREMESAFDDGLSSSNLSAILVGSPSVLEATVREMPQKDPIIALAKLGGPDSSRLVDIASTKEAANGRASAYKRRLPIFWLTPRLSNGL